LFSCFVRFAFYFVFCAFILFGVLFLPIYSCLFSICLQFYRTLPPCGNPVAVNKYHIISYGYCLVLIRFGLATTYISAHAIPA